MTIYRVDDAQVRDAVTGEPNTGLVGQQVQIVTRDTTTPAAIQDAAGDPIPDSMLTVTTAISVPRFYIDVVDPTELYLDWYDVGSGVRGPVNFEAVLRQLAKDAVGAVKSVNGVGPDETGNVAIEAGGGGTMDHGALSGLADDDHPQYHTDVRGDARYYTKEATASLVANSVAAAAPANRDRGNHTGFQQISTVTNLESRLAALESGSAGSGILLIDEGTEPPLGTPPGLIGYIPGGVGPTPTLFESISHDSEGSTVTCPVPTGVAIGDAVVFLPGFVAAAGDVSNITVSDAGWEEKIDYSANHSRDTAMYVYRVADSTALAALGAAVTADFGVSGRRMAACVVIPGSLVASAWPAYSSSSNRSAATINSNTTEGCTVQGFSTATVPFHKVIAAVMHDGTSAAAAADFTVLGSATGSAGGAVPSTLTVMIKDLAAAPIPAAVVTHPTADSSVHGGGQFIIPVA